jgi:nitrogen fixation/metabolism regulation signal transduction histidine kinase
VSPLAVLSVLLAISLGMMSAATQNSALFGDLYSLLLVLNILGVVLLLTLIGLSVSKLFRQFRARVMGSRLTLRLFGLFVLLSVVPVAVVYLFSVQAFNRIDNCLRIEQALNSARPRAHGARYHQGRPHPQGAICRRTGRQFAARTAADAQCAARTVRRV